MFNRKRSLIPPTEGELVVTRSVVDNMWYRGKICKQEDQKYKVTFLIVKTFYPQAVTCSKYIKYFSIKYEFHRLDAT